MRVHHWDLPTKQESMRYGKGSTLLKKAKTQLSGEETNGKGVRKSNDPGEKTWDSNCTVAS